jgi:Ca2+-binding EF-hand superfamily protein
MRRRQAIASILAALGGSTALLIPSSRAWAAHAVIQELDADHDSTLDLSEVRDAAAKMFDHLDRDQDGTIERKEVGPRISKRDFAAADLNHDGVLTKDEYVALAEKLFHAADVNHYKELGENDLRSPAGRALIRLIH